MIAWCSSNNTCRKCFVRSAHSLAVFGIVISCRAARIMWIHLPILFFFVVCCAVVVNERGHKGLLSPGTVCGWKTWPASSPMIAVRRDWSRIRRIGSHAPAPPSLALSESWLSSQALTSVSQTPSERSLSVPCTPLRAVVFLIWGFQHKLICVNGFLWKDPLSESQYFVK